MKVTISVCGEFHAFQLAKYLYSRSNLDRLITSYPYFKMSRAGLPKDRIVSLPLTEIVKKIRGSNHFLSNLVNLDKYISFFFDNQASKYIRPCDIFVGWSGFSLRSLGKAKSMGAITVIERGSSHIEYQRDILKEAYRQLGIRSMLPPAYIVAKELEEYRESDFITVPSQFVKKTFLDKGISGDKLIRVPHGVDTQAFRPISKEDNIFRIIYVGAMTVRKGVHYLLKSVSELNLKDAETWLIGSMCNDVKPFFKKYRKDFKYLGHIDYHKLYKYYSQGSVFVLPSIEDGFGHVILQAAACGLPIICTVNTGGPDVISEGKEGFIVPICNVDALKEKIVYLYENPHIRQEMGRQALEKVNRNFTWDKYGENMVNAYLNLLKGK